MNYEDLLAGAKAIEKEMTERLKAEQRKSIQKSMEAGDVKSWLRDLELLSQASEAHRDALATLREMVEAFDTREYIESGDFTRQLIEACEDADLDIKGEFPTYEIFPYRLRVDAENQDLYVDRKKMQCLRPKSFASGLKTSREKLMRVSFNAAAFAAELANAYDIALACQASGKTYVKDADCYLSSLYSYMAPMSRLRREYDKQSYAFDLARLYISDIDEIKGGRKFQFGPARNNNKAIRILDGDGGERFLTTIRFYHDDTEGNDA